jgi:NADP-dependent 3-hydroxy acid dehydrogenase YdfG
MWLINMNLHDKVAFITGAASGIGRSCALLFAQEGVKIAIVDKNSKFLEETASIIKRSNSEVLYESVDIVERNQVNEAVKKAIQTYSKIDFLVNAAGINVKKRVLSNMDPRDWDRIIDVNLSGCYNCVQAILPFMKKQNEGTIVNIVSDRGRLVKKSSGIAYTAAKHGLYGFSQSINHEEWENGIRACAILPGEVDTPLVREKEMPPDADHISIMLKPNDVAEAVMFAVTRPKQVLVQEIVITPTNRAY